MSKYKTDQILKEFDTLEYQIIHTHNAYDMKELQYHRMIYSVCDKVYFIRLELESGVLYSAPFIPYKSVGFIGYFGEHWVKEDGRIIKLPKSIRVTLAPSRLARNDMRICTMNKNADLALYLNLRNPTHDWYKGDANHLILGHIVMSTDKQYEFKNPILGWSIWDGEFIVWSNDLIYNFTRDEIVYKADKFIERLTIVYFYNGYAILANIVLSEHCGYKYCHIGDGYNSHCQYYWFKITRKEHKPKRGACVVCFEKPGRMMAYNCGHAVVCPGCDKKIEDCPVCRACISTRTVIILS